MTTERFLIRTSPVLLNALRTAARLEGISMASITNIAIQEWLLRYIEQEHLNVEERTNGS